VGWEPHLVEWYQPKSYPATPPLEYQCNSPTILSLALYTQAAGCLSLKLNGLRKIELKIAEQPCLVSDKKNSPSNTEPIYLSSFEPVQQKLCVYYKGQYRKIFDHFFFFQKLIPHG
jgi:hypothetical protein